MKTFRQYLNEAETNSNSIDSLVDYIVDKFSLYQGSASSSSIDDVYDNDELSDNEQDKAVDELKTLWDLTDANVIDFITATLSGKSFKANKKSVSDGAEVAYYGRGPNYSENDYSYGFSKLVDKIDSDPEGLIKSARSSEDLIPNLKKIAKVSDIFDKISAV